MTKLLRLSAVAAVAALLAAVLFMTGQSSRPTQAQEPRLEIFTFSPLVVERVLELVNEQSPLALSAYDDAGFSGSEPCFLAFALRTVSGDEAGQDALDPDDNGIPCEGNLVEPGQFTADDFALLDALDSEQVTENGDGYWGGLLILVNDKDPEGKPVEFDASDGSFWTLSGNTITEQGPHYTCDAANEDADCTTTSSDFHDGMYNVAFGGPLDARGDITIEVRVQGDSDRDAATVTLHGVGDPETLAPLLNLDPKLEVGGTGVCKPGGEDFTFANLLQITTLAGLPDAGLVAVQVLDSDGTSLTGVPVEWESADEDVVIPGFDSQFSLFNSGLLLGPNLMCSGSETGTGTVEVRVEDAAGSDPADPRSERSVPQESLELSWTVIGRPAQMVAYADPATIDCNGVNTSTVTAQVFDASANPGVAGREVRFDLQVLGTANPITATTSPDGIATSVVTPLVQEGATGVPVIVTGPLGIQSTVLVNCQVGAGAGTSGNPPPPPPPSGGQPPPTGSISGPDTGSGNAAGRGSLPVWPAVALFVAAMGLAGARFGLKRS